VPFPDPAQPGLARKFPANATAARLRALEESVTWYVKVPYLSAGITAEHIGALFAALPELLGQLRGTIAIDLKEPQLALRLPGPLVQAFLALQ
jgi:hypothetical protein